MSVLSLLMPRQRSVRQLGRLGGLLLLIGGLGAGSSQAQTPSLGLIFKPATAGTPGSAVLDPNGDGYVSSKVGGVTAPFTTANGDLGTRSEIPYKYLPQRSTEPNADLRVGPSNKFTDFADVAGGGSSVGFYVDANSNYMFRFRLGGAAPNSKGYSIAIDTDNKFGFTGPNADPNAVAGNPGFEMEILLASNFGVRLYNLDGTASPSDRGLDNVAGPDNSMIELPFASYAQKAIAATTNDGNLDVFYDFYIPLSVIQAQFGNRTFFNSTGTTAVPFSNTTSLRMVANTIIAPHSVTQTQNISDIGGVNDTQYANTDNAFVDLISGTTPTSGTTLPTTTGNVIPPRTPTAPVVNSPILSGATTVRGTSAEAVGTVITVYVQQPGGTYPAVGTTTVQSGGTWTMTGVPALASGALVKATATASGKTESVFSNEVQVGSTPLCSSAPLQSAAITCSSDRGVRGTAPAGSRVYLRYLDGSLVPAGASSGQNKQIDANFVVADASGIFFFSSGGGNATCSNGQTNVLAGSYLVSYTALTSAAGAPPTYGCESAGLQICISNGTATTQTATPTVTTAKPITAATTSISGTTVTGARVSLYIDGGLFTSITATGTTYTFSTANGTLPTLTTGRALRITANANGTACESAPIALNVVENRTVVPPVITGPLLVGATTISGTSSEAPGSVITLTRFSALNGGGTGTSVATTPLTVVVQANGTWTATVPTLTAGTSYRAVVTPPDYSPSTASGAENVQTLTASAPVITGTYQEKGTSVSGTTTALVGSIVTVYIDGGDPIGTATVVAGTAGGPNTWTLTGLAAGSATTSPTLYAGGILTATVTEAGRLPSAPSAGVTVGCATIANKSFSASPICQNQAGTFTVTNVEPGVIYTLQTSPSGTTTGFSQVGTGTGTSSLSLPTDLYSTPGTYAFQLNAFSIGASNCSNTTSAVNLVVNPLPVEKTVNAAATSLSRSNTGTTITVVSSESGVVYQLINATASPNTEVGPTQTGNGGTLSFPTGYVNGTTTYAISALTPNGCSRRLAQTQTVAAPLPVELSAFEVAARNTAAVLTWTTASEKNNNYFEIERSADGHLFTAIGQVGGQGTSGQVHHYTFTDARSASYGSPVYYRLRQVDTDLTAAYSPVRTVNFAVAGLKAKVVLYPNPATSSVTLSLKNLPAGSYTVRVVSLTGQVLQTVQGTGGENRDLAIASLPAGVYVVQVQGASLNLSQSLVKMQ